MLDETHLFCRGGPDQDVKGCGAGLCRPGDVMFPTDAYLGTQNDIDVMIAYDHTD